MDTDRGTVTQSSVPRSRGGLCPRHRDHAGDSGRTRRAGIRRIEDPEQAPLHAAYLEIHARASRTEAYREALAATDCRYREELATIVEEGIDAGVFREVDPWTTATLLVAVPDSAGLHAATLGTESAVEDLRSAVNELLLESLLAEDVDVEKGDLL